MDETLRKNDQKLAIVCTDEPLILSNERALEVWNTLDELLEILLKESPFASSSTLFAWKSEPRHLASAKEPYAWRAAIEEIKNSDLTAKCVALKDNSEKLVLITDKPVMLKIAGEITNAALHSYTSRHRISFVPVQRESKVPS
jgi:hypothetical protein